MRTFEASEVTQWADDAALCPVCHVDAVLSASAKPIDAAFLARMNNAYFSKTSPHKMGSDEAEQGLNEF